MKDPTREEMLATLASYGPEGNDDLEIAIYWFASHYHGGQDSNLYSVLSTSPFDPGPIATLESEGDGIVRMMYEDLVAQYGT